jgi:hypothetical protein
MYIITERAFNGMPVVDGPDIEAPVKRYHEARKDNFAAFFPVKKDPQPFGVFTQREKDPDYTK